MDSERQELYARVFDQESTSPLQLTHDWAIARTKSMSFDEDFDQLPLIRCGGGGELVGKKNTA